MKIFLAGNEAPPVTVNATSAKLEFNPAKCEFCGREFKSKKSKNMHKSKVHQEEIRDQRKQIYPKSLNLGPNSDLFEQNGQNLVLFCTSKYYMKFQTMIKNNSVL